MSMRKVLGVDVDLTVVDTGRAWMKWLDELTGRNLCYELDISYQDNNTPYDLTKLYSPWLENTVDGYDFWRQPNLYDSLLPEMGVVETLSTLSKGGWDIVFVSTVKGFHGKSKYYWLKRHFPFMAGALWTKEKHYVACDAIIDDRNKILNKMPEHVKCYRPYTIYTQDEEMKRPFEHLDLWEGGAINQIMEGSK